MLDGRVRDLIADRGIFFRGTDDFAIEKNTSGGMYCGTPDFLQTSTTTSLDHALAWASGLGLEHTYGLPLLKWGNPVLLAINAVPYFDRIEEKMELLYFTDCTGKLSVGDEYVIHGPIRTDDMEVIGSVEQLRRYAGRIDYFDRMKDFFERDVLYRDVA